MSDPFGELERHFLAWVDAIGQGIEQGLAAGAAIVQDAAQAADSYGDRSGATRAGTVAYPLTPTQDGADAFSAALAAVERENPGHGASEDAGLTPTEERRYVVATVPTVYQSLLELSNGGEHAVLQPIMDAYAPQIHEAVERAIEDATR